MAAATPLALKGRAAIVRGTAPGTPPSNPICPVPNGARRPSLFRQRAKLKRSTRRKSWLLRADEVKNIASALRQNALKLPSGCQTRHCAEVKGRASTSQFVDRDAILHYTRCSQ